MDIEYDLVKAASNVAKHGINFDEAVTALYDERALVMEDTSSEGENRWVLIGMSDQTRLITVIYSLRSDVVRIISARKATKKEAMHYA